MAPFNQLGVTRFPATVWIDDQGRMRQLAYTLTVEEENAGMPAGTRLDYLIEVWDFGVKVNVNEPPAKQVADLDEVLGEMEQSLEDLQAISTSSAPSSKGQAAAEKRRRSRPHPAEVGAERTSGNRHRSSVRDHAFRGFTNI